jgi:adenylate cyclase
MTESARKLATIVALDVAGYSARTEADEAKTTAEIVALRPIIEGIAKARGGRVFNTAGDGFMLEFGSSLAAVEAAFELAATCEPKVRIGVHVGDVVVQPNGDLLGHGVNVAARLMAKSDPGGALVSADVRRMIRGPVADRLVSRGAMQLDKMAETIEAFATVGVAVAPVHTAIAHKAEHKLSVCVLAFSNLSDDPQQEYFSDGISEDIITDLTKVSALGVTARNTSFQFKGKSFDVPTIARQLKVTHVLEGSVRKAGGRLRITAQLIDGATGQHIWAERYDRDLSDIFALQDEIAHAIVGALKLKLLPEERKAIEQRGTTSLEAYNLYLMARRIYVGGNLATARASNAVIRLCTAATNLDPNYGKAWGAIAIARAVRNTMSNAPDDEALMAAERAIALDASLAEPHAAKARILAHRGDMKGALAEADEALRLGSDSMEVQIPCGVLYGISGRTDLAIACFEKACALLDSAFLGFGLLMDTYLTQGDREMARRYAERALPRTQAALAKEPDNGGAIGVQALSLAVLGQAEAAREQITQGLLLDPDNEMMKLHFLRTAAYLRDDERAFALLEPVLKNGAPFVVAGIAFLPDFVHLRSDPRYQSLMAATQARLAAQRAEPKR